MAVTHRVAAGDGDNATRMSLPQLFSGRGKRNDVELHVPSSSVDAGGGQPIVGVYAVGSNVGEGIEWS